MTYWVRLWADLPTDPKWRVIAKRSGRPISEVMSVFMFMMVNAGERRPNATERGELANWSDEDTAAALDIDPQHVTCIREAMQGKTLDGNKLSGWEKRQPIRDDGSAERAREWRERNRTQPNAEKRPDIDTDIDTEKKEKGARVRASFDAEFEKDFWPVYPEKVGKRTALTAFNSARKRTELAPMLAGLRNYITSKPIDRPWCNPSTWLNQDRWLDQPATAANVLPFGTDPPKREFTADERAAAAERWKQELARQAEAK